VQLVQLVPVIRVPAGHGTHEDERITNPWLHWYGQFDAEVPIPV